MEVNLVTVTPRAENTILHCARVSSDQSNESTGLIKYLIRNGHWSPFELAHMVVEITTSRAIAQQILRHRSFSFQEFSQRYASPDSFEMYEARRQAEKSRQSSIDDMDNLTKVWFEGAQQHIWDEAKTLYDYAIEKGIAKEQARFLLPLNTTTKLYMSGSLRSWIHYLGDGPGGRTNPHTQQEHRDIALAIKAIFTEQFPIIAEALDSV